MKIFLQNYNEFDTIGVLDTSNGIFCEIKKKEKENILIKGFYSLLGSYRVLFFENEGGLFIQINGKRYLVESETRVEHKRGFCSNKFILWNQIEKYRQTIKYPINKLDPPIEDSFTMSEEEDFDFGLFLCNVLSDDPRLNRLKKQWSSGTFED